MKTNRMKTPSLVPCLLALPGVLAGASAPSSTHHSLETHTSYAARTGTPAAACNPPASATFTAFLPKVGQPPDEEGQGWTRPPVWEHLPDATDDSITDPNGRPIYALIVSGSGSNKYLDELMVYNFARHLMARGAYVHYAWWNNLLAPYMERPLHHLQSHLPRLAEGHEKLAARSCSRAHKICGTTPAVVGV